MPGVRELADLASPDEVNNLGAVKRHFADPAFGVCSPERFCHAELNLSCQLSILALPEVVRKSLERLTRFGVPGFVGRGTTLNA